jgi:AraC family transcriptional regulator
MQMLPHIEDAAPRFLVGLHATMSLQVNGIQALWQAFMPQRDQVTTEGANGPLCTLRSYPQAYFEAFRPETPYTQWVGKLLAARPDVVPDGMTCLEVPGGPYAVFSYVGPGGSAAPYQYIFGQWLPAADYVLDHARPHFEVLGEAYRQGAPENEEDIWIPITRKGP